ncbi:MAG: methylamine utilization protein MauG [Rhodobacteraceae bacterium]|nr:methylamine utilization protein MauG [Paracoccaceae bacterium]
MLFHRFLFPLVLVATSAQADLLTPDQFHEFDQDKARIGQLLFYDKILSGNRNISCGTCHHHTQGSADGLSLGVGEGGQGVGLDRTAGAGRDKIVKRIPRNAPALWNLGHKSVQTVFHDGRLSISDIYDNGYNSPAEEWLPKGLETIIAAQALFPVTSHAEMAGEVGDNQIAGAVNDRIDNAWPIIAKRVRTIPAYGAMFVAAFDHINSPEEVTMVEIGNAIAAFIGTEWKSTDTVYDDFVRDGNALPENAERGRQLFFGEAGCSGCHNGPLFTDHNFYAIGLPAFGPGRTRRFDPIPRDVGRMGETDSLEDAYRFKTPSLRNVELTGPYGHNGAYPKLTDMIRHMADPATTRASWTRETPILPEAPWLAKADFIIQEDRLEMLRQATVSDITPVQLSDQDILDIEAFLHCLTDKKGNTRPLGVPAWVPSGLSVD